MVEVLLTCILVVLMACALVLARISDTMRRAERRETEGITVHAPNYVGDAKDLKRALVDMSRRGQLDRLT